MAIVKNLVSGIAKRLASGLVGGSSGSVVYDPKSWGAHETGGISEATWDDFATGGASPTTWQDLET